MDITLISSMFEELPRQGPGLDEATLRACSNIPQTGKDEKILDIGCGSGMQTLTVARSFPQCLITATDLHQPFLDDLDSRAKKAGLDGRITTSRVSMDDLPFEDESFDIIWAEGSAFVIGLSNALTYWRQFLKPDGYLVVSDCTWFTDNPSDECQAFFDLIYPDVLSESGTADLVRAAGFTVVDSFRLPDNGWWDHFYTPLTDRIPLLKERYGDNPDAMAIIGGLEMEMDIHRKYASEYGYSYFVAQKNKKA